MQKFMSMSRDDLVVNSLSTSFDKLREWPYCVGSPEAIKDQSFLPRHARLALALAGEHPTNPLQLDITQREFAWQHSIDALGDSPSPPCPGSSKWPLQVSLTRKGMMHVNKTLEPRRYALALLKLPTLTRSHMTGMIHVNNILMPGTLALAILNPATATTSSHEGHDACQHDTDAWRICPDSTQPTHGSSQISCEGDDPCQQTLPTRLCTHFDQILTKTHMKGKIQVNIAARNMSFVLALSRIPAHFDQSEHEGNDLCPGH